MSYNIWFEKLSKERLDEITKIILEVDADFICL
jgi:hypothetical protein